MKILSISVDNSVFKKDSAVAKRTIEYGEAVDKYVVLVPDRNSKKGFSAQLSEKVFTYSAPSSNPLLGLFNIFSQANKILKKENFNILTIGDQYYLALLGWVLAKKFGLGLNLQIHGFEKYAGLRKLVARFVIPRANSIRVVSERLKKQMIKEFGVEENKITIVPIFAEIETLGDKKRKTKELGKNFVFLTASRLVPVKNIAMQIRAMARVIKKYPNVELWIVGEGPEKENLKSQIANLKIENNVKILGWQENVGEFYNQADAFLLTSDYEGWGMVIIEAASYSLPIIMTDVGCAGEVVKDGESALIISVGKEEELEKAMLRLIEENNLRETLGQVAQQIIKNLPGKAKTLELYKENWQKTANRKPKICYILPRYDQKDHTHFSHIYDFLREISKEVDLLLIIEKTVGQINKNNLKNELGVKDIFVQKYDFPTKAIENLLLILKARLGGYRDFYVHYSFLSAFNASLVAKIIGGRVFYWNCGLPWKYQRPFLRDSFEKLVYKSISYLVTGAKSLSLGYSQNYGISQEKIKIMPNWIDLKRFKDSSNKTDLRKKLNIPENRKVVLFIHHLTPRKGSHMIVPVARELSGLQENFLFIIIGSGSGESELKSQIKDLSLETVIDPRGSIPNTQIPEYLLAADAFFMPSQEEGFPRVILETMAMGVPFVASDVGAVKEIIPKEMLEYVVTSSETKEFAEKLNKILSMTDRELSTLSNIEKDYVKQYDIGIITKSFIKLFE